MRWEGLTSFFYDDSDGRVNWGLWSSDEINLIFVYFRAYSTDLVWLNNMNKSSIYQWVKNARSKCKIIGWIRNDDGIAWGWQINSLYIYIIDFEILVRCIVHNSLNLDIKLLWTCKLLGKSNGLFESRFSCLDFYLT